MIVACLTKSPIIEESHVFSWEERTVCNSFTNNSTNAELMSQFAILEFTIIDSK